MFLNAISPADRGHVTHQASGQPVWERHLGGQDHHLIYR